MRFTAAKGSPELDAVKLAYTDSVLFSLPIAAMRSGAYIVDLNPVFMSDLPQIAEVLSGFRFSASKSSWSDVKVYPDNAELQVAATYASSGSSHIDSVADSRGVSLGIHYSISKLPATGSYQPRLADDRVGYFLTVIKDYSKQGPDERFVRYINRWDVRKADPSADTSPPKKPIIFWIEKTVPYVYRKSIADGIREWNKAYEQAGFYDAIQVRQQPESAKWDPEDINYNTFRWITASAGFAMGPSRVNPRTGQILDADIIFDADFLQYWKRTYETFTPDGIALLTGGPLDLDSYHQPRAGRSAACQHGCGACDFFSGLAHEFAISAAVMTARDHRGRDLEKLIRQGIKCITMHEVGHTLGLRHNFKASTAFSLERINDVSQTDATGLTASVMDYAPANVVPQDETQGDYFSTTIGPYDVWAIQYGYQPMAGDTDAERKHLAEIASRSGKPELAYATDEDTRAIDPDPFSNRWDLGDDILGFARRQARVVQEAWPELADRVTDEGESYHHARRAFGILLTSHGRAMYLAARLVGGVEVNRSHKGDEGAKRPFRVVPPERQRDALKLLESQMLADTPFQFPPELINSLAASRWSHWGTEDVLQVDYPIHSVVLMWQQRIIEHLLSPVTLRRLHDSELKIPADEDAFTTAELIERLTSAVFAELDQSVERQYTNRQPFISSFRRNLQRSYVASVSRLAMGKTDAPQDCQTVAFARLSHLRGRIQNCLDADLDLDTYSRAHLVETARRIHKVLDARLELPAL